MKNRKFWFFVLLFLGISIILSPQNSEKWYQGKTIIDIEFKNLKRVSENQLKGILKQYIGKKFEEELSWDMVSKLYSLEYFDYIETEIEPGDENRNTVILIFNITEKKYIEEINFIGNNKIRKARLLETILTKENEIIDNTTLMADRDAILDLYREDGFTDVEVDVKKEVSEKGDSLIIYFTIKEGIQTRIKEINIEGNTDFPEDKTIKKLMNTEEQSFLRKGIFSERVLQEDITNIKNFYKERGYIDIKIDDIDKKTVRDEESGINGMILTIVISEGISYTLNEIEIKGNELYKKSTLLDEIDLEPGDKVDMLKFERGYMSITDLYHENGYIFNNFDYQISRNRDERTVSFVITISERQRAHIENITIKGNSKTKEYVIRRELSIEEGDVFNKEKLMESVKNLYNTQFFESVNPIPGEGSEELLMDLELGIKEGRTTNIQFGLTFGGGVDFPISGQLKWQDKNVFGTGKTVGIESLFSFDSQTLSLQYSDPWLAGVRWNGGFNLSYKHKKNKFISQDMDGNDIPDPYLTMEEYQAANNIAPSSYQMEYDSHDLSLGFSTGYSWHTQLAKIVVSGSLNSGLEYINYDDNVFMPYNDSLVNNNKSWQYEDSFYIKTAFDGRDFVYDPKEGFILSQSATVGGLADIAQDEYIKSVSRLGLFHTLFSFNYDENKRFMGVIDLNTAFSYLFEKPWKEHDIDTNKYGFTIDGMFVGKGWDMVLNGKALWDSSLTLKFPFVQNVAAFDLFLDAVGIWNTKEDLEKLELKDFRFGAGWGLRFANPSFPIGIYMVKKFKFDENNSINWNPEPPYSLSNIGMDLVIAFDIDMY